MQTRPWKNFLKKPKKEIGFPIRFSLFSQITALFSAQPLWNEQKLLMILFY